MNNVTKYFPFIAFLLAAIALGIVLLRSEKTAYVNSGVIMEKYQGMIDARKKYEETSKTWQSNADTLAAEFQESLKKYEKDITTMSAKEKQMAQELLKNKQQQVMQYQQAIQQKAEQEQGKLSEGAIKQINSYIENYGKKHHYKIIFGTNNGNIVYADKSVEITDQILDGLNEEYKGKK